jgi:hypothetical protein
MLSKSWRASSGERIGVLPRFTTCLGPSNHRGRIAPDDLADHEPVEQHAHRRQVLLDRGRRVGLAQVLDVGGDVDRLEAAELAEAADLAPAEKLGNSPGVGVPGIAVADVGGEELEKAAAGVIAGGGDLRRDQGVGVREGERIVHAMSVANSFPEKKDIKDVMGWNWRREDERFSPASSAQTFWDRITPWSESPRPPIFSPLRSNIKG